MGERLNIDQLKSLEGGTIRLVVETGTFFSRLTQIDVVEVPEVGKIPQHQQLVLHHTGFFEKDSTTVAAAEPNPMTFRNLDLDWHWQEGKIVALEGVLTAFTISPPTR